MRNIFINGRFLSECHSAVNNVALSLTLAFIKKCKGEGTNWKVHVVVPPALVAKAEELGLPVLVWGRFNGIAWEQLELPRLRHRGLILGFFNTVPIGGKGYVSMLHDAHPFTTPHSYPMLTRLWRRFLARRAGRGGGNWVLTVSEHSRRQLLSLGIAGKDQIFIVPNGVEVPRSFDEQIFDRLRLDKGCPYFVAFSNTMPHKNIPTLLEAFNTLGTDVAKLVLVGRAQRHDYEAMGCFANSNVVFSGFVTAAELSSLYQSALAVCIASTEEGFGLPVLEALVNGTLPLVAPCGALPEVVGSVGHVVKENSVDSWRVEMERLIAQPDISTAQKKAREMYAAGYTWEAAAERLLAHLKVIMEA